MDHVTAVRRRPQIACRPDRRTGNYQLASTLLACLAFLVPLVVPALAAGQEDLQKANIAISLTETRRDGATFAPVSVSGASKVGETTTRYINTTANGEGTGARAGTPPATVGYDFLWQVDVTVLSIGLDVVTFDLNWRRTDVKDDARLVVPGDHRTITLHQGEKHVLDFVLCPPDSRYANVFLTIEATPVEDASVANLGFSYDLWLVHRTAEGAKVTRHAVLTGRQGEKLKFAFAPVPLPLEATGPESDSPFKLDVSGTITGRQKPDGMLEIALEPSRRHRFSTGWGGSAGGGVKTFTSRIDETTSVTLPAGSGFSSWGGGDTVTLTNPHRGVSVTGSTIRVDTKAYFEGTETSILVTIRRER